MRIIETAIRCICSENNDSLVLICTFLEKSQSADISDPENFADVIPVRELWSESTHVRLEQSHVTVAEKICNRFFCLLPVNSVLQQPPT